MTMRLSASSFAGTARTLVAVGTVSETFMFLTTAAAAPRSGDCLPAATGPGLAAGFSAGFAAGEPAAFSSAAGALRAGGAVGAFSAGFAAPAVAWAGGAAGAGAF